MPCEDIQEKYGKGIINMSNGETTKDTQVTVKCPHCGKEVEVTRSVIHGTVVKVGVCEYCKEEIRIEREV